MVAVAEAGSAALDAEAAEEAAAAEAEAEADAESDAEADALSDGRMAYSTNVSEEPVPVRLAAMAKLPLRPVYAMP